MTTIFCCLYAFAFLATIELAGLQTSLLTYGPLGVICIWLMLRDEKRDQSIRDLSHRINGLSKALLLDILGRPVDAPTRQLAKDMLDKAEKGELK